MLSFLDAVRNGSTSTGAAMNVASTMVNSFAPPASYRLPPGPSWHCLTCAHSSLLSTVNVRSAVAN